jgi:hypothetical protein
VHHRLLAQLRKEGVVDALFVLGAICTSVYLARRAR